MAMAVSSSSSMGMVSMFRGLSLSSSLSSVVGGEPSSSSLLVVRRERVSPPPSLTIESAHKKGSGSTKNGRDSAGKRLGVKIYGGQDAKPGSIIIRQRGTKFHPGTNVGLGRDYTIFSLIDGEVKFEKFGIDKKKVSVYPKIAQPENPNSRRARMREFFRLRRERRRGYEEVEVIEGTLSLASADSVEPDNDEKTLC